MVVLSSHMTVRTRSPLGPQVQRAPSTLYDLIINIIYISFCLVDDILDASTLTDEYGKEIIDRIVERQFREPGVVGAMAEAYRTCEL